MMNSTALQVVLCAAAGFIGALIGHSFTGSSPSIAATSPKTVVAESNQCPPPPPCPRAASCPRCEACEAAECPACPSCPVSRSAHSSASSIGDEVAPAPAPLPKGSYDAQKFYPLHGVENRFENWYDNHRTGKGVWKWTQYFPAWERHLAKFVKKSWSGELVHMAELGIFSGGSLEMWQHVFGPGLRLWGVDLAAVTKQYETDDKSGRTRVFNMDQTSSEAWDKFKKLVPKLDILIDDGLHLFTGQKSTFDNIVNHIAPGGVFMTEDISDGRQPGARPYNGPNYKEKYLDYSFQQSRPLHYAQSHFQKTVDSVHYYPYLFVLEKREKPLRPLGSGSPLAAIKHGTKWKPITRGVTNGLRFVGTSEDVKAEDIASNQQNQGGSQEGGDAQDGAAENAKEEGSEQGDSNTGEV